MILPTRLEQPLQCRYENSLVTLSCIGTVVVGCLLFSSRLYGCVVSGDKQMTVLIAALGSFTGLRIRSGRMEKRMMFHPSENAVGRLGVAFVGFKMYAGCGARTHDLSLA